MEMPAVILDLSLDDDDISKIISPFLTLGSSRVCRPANTPPEHLSHPPHRYRSSHRQHVRVLLVGGEADAATRAEGTGDV